MRRGVGGACMFSTAVLGWAMCSYGAEAIQSPETTHKSEVAPARQELVVDLGNDVKLEMVWIEPGEFVMGSPADEEGRTIDETQHRVRITKGFWMGKYEVTQRQWEALMGDNPSSHQHAGADAPVEKVSWQDCQEFILKLNRLDKRGTFRLPTEAEWEYACRAGTATALYTGPLTIEGRNNAPALDPIAWYGGNSGVAYDGAYDSRKWREKQYAHTQAGTHEVGQKRPNAWGLYDMLGNVQEWCQDWYGAYPSDSVSDPSGPSSGSYRVLRGGCWCYLPKFSRSASRYEMIPTLRYGSNGFRVVLVP